MIRDTYRAALAALVLWPATDRPAPAVQAPPPPAAVQAVPVPVPYPLAVQAPLPYNPPPSRLRATIAAALDRLDRWAPF